MTKRGLPDSTRSSARSSADASTVELAAPMHALTAAAVPAADRSFPAALCRVAAEIGFEADEGRSPPETRDGDGGERGGGRRDDLEDVLEPVVTAVTRLEGYVRLRRALVDGSGDDGPIAFEGVPTVDRDAAILASDHLHAGAYATMAATPVSDRRRLELYRLLAEGSTALTHRFLSHVDGENSTDGRSGVLATLAETAGALGAAAAGASTETRTALGTYSRELMTALASQSAAVGTGADPRASAVRVLTDESNHRPTDAAADRRAVADDDRESESAPAVDRCLERACEALESIAGADATDATGDTDDESTPLARLERATRVPFRCD